MTSVDQELRSAISLVAHCREHRLVKSGDTKGAAVVALDRLRWQVRIGTIAFCLALAGSLLLPLCSIVFPEQPPMPPTAMVFAMLPPLLTYAIRGNSVVALRRMELLYRLAAQDV